MIEVPVMILCMVVCVINKILSLKTIDLTLRPKIILYDVQIVPVTADQISYSVKLAWVIAY